MNRRAASEMNEPDSLGWDRAQDVRRAEPEVCRVRVEIVQIEQQIRPGRREQTGQPCLLVEIVPGWIDDRRNILDERKRADRAGRAIDVPGCGVDRAARSRGRREMPELYAARADECEMLRPAYGLHVVDQPGELSEPPLVHCRRGGQPERDAESRRASPGPACEAHVGKRATPETSLRG